MAVPFWKVHFFPLGPFRMMPPQGQMGVRQPDGHVYPTFSMLVIAPLVCANRKISNEILKVKKAIKKAVILCCDFGCFLSSGNMMIGNNKHKTASLAYR